MKYKLPQIIEIIKEFENIGIEIETDNNWIHIKNQYTYIDSPQVIENLCKNVLGNNINSFVYKTIISINTGNDYDPVKTNLIIRVKDISDNELKKLFEDYLNKINKWFNRKNNFINSFLNIQCKLEDRGQLNSEFTIPFRPTLVLDYFRSTMIDAGFQDNFVGFKPTKDGTRSIIYNFYGNMLSLKYEHTKEFERLTILTDCIYYSENIIVYDDSELINTIERIKRIYLRITRKFKRRNTLEKYSLFKLKSKK